jgi:type IV pilus secretin PilQ/predicted competence protein
MKRLRLTLVLPVLSLWLVSFSWNQTPQPSAVIKQMIVVPSRLHTQIRLEASAPLSYLKASYPREFPSTLVVELGRVQVPEAPPIPYDPTPLLKEVKLQAASDLNVSLFLTLLEPVPFRIFSEDGTNVIELTKILRTGSNIPSSEIQEELAKTPRKSAPLDKIDFSDDAGRQDIVVRLRQKPIVAVFALGNPLRLVVDSYDTEYLPPTSTRSIGQEGAEKVKVGQFKLAPPLSVTRFVFELKEPRLYALEKGPQDFKISFFAEPATPAAVAAPPSPPTALAEPPAKPAEAEAAKETEAKAAVASKTIPAPKDKGAPAPPKATPPEAALASEAKTEEKPAANAQEDKAKFKTIHDVSVKYSGDLISPRFKDADLRDVVLWLGERVELNVIFDPGVRGSVTCNFTDVPWDQFLDTILKNNRLGKILEGNILRIAPMSALADEEEAQRNLRDAQEQSGPIQTKTFSLSYAKTREVLELIKNKKSARGEITSDDRTNTLIVSDVKEKLDLIEKLIATLDTQTPQVQIETRIVEATSTFVRNMGIQWGGRGIADPFYGNQTSLQFPNSVSVNGAMIPKGIVTRGIGGPLGGYAINLPAPAFSTALGVSFANVLDTFRLDVALTALESKGEGRIVSSQRVAVQNNKEAYINQGRQIPVQTSANFTVTTQYVNAGLELRATPQITADGTIIMLLDIQNNAADFANLVNGIPPITTQSAKTTVMVPDGGTTAIGGIYRVEDAITREGVPLLHQIPLLGSLFRSFSKTRQNRELLIFITPRIIQ